MNIFDVGVFGVITDKDDNILLCHRCDYDFWNLPGGGVEAGESPDKALIREVREETGLDVIPTHLTGVYSKPQENGIVLSFVCKVTGGAITLTEEANKIEYFAINKIPENIIPKQLERIKDYFIDKNKTYYKVQMGPSFKDLIKGGTLKGKIV